MTSTACTRSTLLTSFGLPFTFQAIVPTLKILHPKHSSEYGNRRKQSRSKRLRATFSRSPGTFFFKEFDTFLVKVRCSTTRRTHFRARTSTWKRKLSSLQSWLQCRECGL